MYTRGIPEYEKLGVNQWMEGNAFWYAKLLSERMQECLQEQAFEISKNVTTVLLNLLSLIRTVLICSMKMANFVAKVKPGYNDLDWLNALNVQVIVQEYTASADAMGDKYDVFSSFWLSE